MKIHHDAEKAAETPYKLTAATRDALTIGDTITSGTFAAVVTNIIKYPRGAVITVQVPDGRHIYAVPLSSYYGVTVTPRG